jgi:FixJ family two-component response regulator
MRLEPVVWMIGRTPTKLDRPPEGACKDAMQGKREHIVVVDDDLGMAQALRRLLEASGFHAAVFQSGEALLESEVVMTAACLILDINLPGVSGFELSQRLRASGHKVPFIFITADEDPEVQAQARAAGAVACLTEPFPAKALLAAIAKAMNHSQATESGGSYRP